MGVPAIGGGQMLHRVLSWACVLSAVVRVQMPGVRNHKFNVDHNGDCNQNPAGNI